MIKRLLIFIFSMILFVLTALFLKSGDIKINSKQYVDRISFELNKKFDTKGLITLDSLSASDLSFQNKLTLVQFSYNACGACRRDKQLFNSILKETPEEFQIVTISIDNFSFWKKINKKQRRWIKINIGNSDLRNQLKVSNYPTYFVVNNKGKIISRPNDGIDFIRRYYNIKSTTNISLFRDYIANLNETKRFWNQSFPYVVIYLIVLGGIFFIVSIILSIKQRKFSKKTLLIWLAVYVVSTLLFFNLIYFTDGRSEMRKVNTKNHHMIGEKFMVDTLNLKNPNNPVSFDGKLTLINFYHMNDLFSMKEICGIPSLLRVLPDSFQVISLGINDYDKFQNKLNDTEYKWFNVTSKDTVRWKLNYQADTLRWKQFHRSELGNFVNKLDLKKIPESFVIDSNGRITDRPTNGVEFMKLYKYRKPSFNEFYKYLNKYGGIMTFLGRSLLFFLGIYGLLQFVRFIIKGKSTWR